jgi:6-phosphogluconate dehydrogenase
MELGIVGLGKMGGNMADRLLKGGHTVLGYDPNPAVRDRIAANGGGACDSLAALVQKLSAPRAVWIMVPSGDPVQHTIDALLPILSEGDTIIDGGNSNYKDSQRRGAEVQSHGINFVDVGTSGGVWGLEGGYSMMIGGDDAPVERLRPIFETLAPSPTEGWGHVGPIGAGHFVKMVHNGIEYGLMQAYAEGFSILDKKKEFALDLHQVADVWRTGSVVRSWLLDLLAAELAENPELGGLSAAVADSGEGRWTVAEAVDLNVPAPVITISLMERLSSRDKNSFSHRLLSALRHQFGGHASKIEDQDEMPR